MPTKGTTGLGLKYFKMWNKATIAKLVWAIPKKKDILWVRWIHGTHLKEKSWWNYFPAPDCSWYWKRSTRLRMNSSRPVAKLMSLNGKEDTIIM